MIHCPSRSSRTRSFSTPLRAAVLLGLGHGNRFPERYGLARNHLPQCGVELCLVYHQVVGHTTLSGTFHPPSQATTSPFFRKRSRRIATPFSDTLDLLDISEIDRDLKYVICLPCAETISRWPLSRKTFSTFRSKNSCRIQRHCSSKVLGHPITATAPAINAHRAPFQLNRKCRASGQSTMRAIVRYGKR